MWDWSILEPAEASLEAEVGEKEYDRSSSRYARDIEENALDTPVRLEAWTCVWALVNGLEYTSDTPVIVCLDHTLDAWITCAKTTYTCSNWTYTCNSC